MPQDLPGFYYDEEKNRYFPIKGPIPGSSSRPSSSASTSAPQKSDLKPTSAGIARFKTAKLLQARELYGNVITSGKGRFSFQEEYLKLQASQPMIWKYQGTERVADGALEQIRIDLDIPDGPIETDVLLTGGLNGSLCFYEVGKVGQRFVHGEESIPDRVWPVSRLKQPGFVKLPGHLWRPVVSSIQMSSSISCIKTHSSTAADNASPTQLVLYGMKRQLNLACYRNSPCISEIPFSCVTFSGSHKKFCHLLRLKYLTKGNRITTLGSETCGGSVNILNVSEPLPYSPSISVLRQRIHRITTFDSTVWTADCNSNGSRAVIGTNIGAVLVDIETGKSSWVCRCKSDVFSLQLNHSSNAVLCGLRNGAIVTIDTRQKPEGFPARLTSHRLPYPSRNTSNPSSRSDKKFSRQWFQLKGNICHSGTTYMPSSVSCLALLKLYDRYFLGSSMDGSIKLYDHRLIQRGAILSYEGNMNSHSRLQLGVDPSERFVMSGGEDCRLRLWSIKSGELLFEDKFMNSVPSVLCWGQAEDVQNTRDGYRDYQHNHCRGAWVGSEEGLYYVDST